MPESTAASADLASPDITLRADVGYGHAAYAASLREFGTPRALSASGGWALERRIEGTPWCDAMGPYPLFVCDDWAQLPPDMQAYASDWVSMSWVTGPFAPVQEVIENDEQGVLRPFKPHWLVDLRIPYDNAVSDHHRYYARYARRKGVAVRRVAPSAARLAQWTSLYDRLIERHDITGMQAFSRASFEQQFEVPGLTIFAAEHEGEPVAMHLWYEMGDIAYSHLAASSDAGYDTHASYALHRAAIDYFRPRTRWLNLGGGVGTPSDEEDGLTRFKKGWATESASAHVCGYVLQPDVYARLVHESETQAATYFPKYRQGELV